MWVLVLAGTVQSWWGGVASLTVTHAQYSELTSSHLSHGGTGHSLSCLCTCNCNLLTRTVSGQHTDQLPPVISYYYCSQWVAIVFNTTGKHLIYAVLRELWGWDVEFSSHQEWAGVWSGWGTGLGFTTCLNVLNPSCAVLSKADLEIDLHQ